MPPDRTPPDPGQESVWDYPRPPRVEASNRHIQVYFNGQVIADSRQAKRVLETSHPPVYYLPPEDVRQEFLLAAPGSTYCEFKGRAAYYHVRVGERQADDAAWYYPEPQPGYGEIQGYIAFYPQYMDACLVDGERALAQPGSFYGGWITADIIGPFKGGPGTSGW